MNELLDYYERHKISPVSQDISDRELHFARRTGLYRTLGLPAMLFRGKDVLEVAPGSGFNSIVTASLGAAIYDLVEPNSTGFERMTAQLREFGNEETALRFFNCPLEKFNEKKSYDIILCEGLVQGLPNQEEFVLKLAGLLKPGGILVLTCSDAISLFFETLRQYLARVLAAQTESAGTDADRFVQLTALLSEAFAPHLASLLGRSRPVADWVHDVLLNPTAPSEAVEHEFSLPRCLEILGDGFWLYGASPDFLTHLAWYKEAPATPRLYNLAYLESFHTRWQCLLHYQEEGLPDAQRNQLLHGFCRELAATVSAKDPLHTPLLSHQAVLEELEPVRKIQALIENRGLDKSLAALSQFLELFEAGLPTPADIARAGTFGSAFGRGQQYISLLKDG